MRINYSAICVLLLFVAFNCLCLGLDKYAQAQENERTISENAAVRIPIKSTNLFDFQQFKQLYRRQYVSLIEELARQKLFLGRAFQVFISSIKFKWHSSRFYLAINHLSDWTKAELHEIAMKPEDFLAPKTDGDDAASFGGDDTTRSSEMKSTDAPDDSASSLDDALNEPVAELSEIEAQLERLAGDTDLARQPGYKQIVDELAVGGKKRKRRDVNEILSSDQAGDQIRGHSEVELPASDDVSVKEPMPVWEASLLSRLPGTRLISRLIDNTAEELVQTFRGAPKLPSKTPKSDGVHVDHRNSRCLSQPKDQDQCGSCYAHAVLSLYEWIHCRETGDLVEFSVQYIIDCGHRVRGLSGCRSGNVWSVGAFAHKFGLELSANYDSPVQPSETVVHQCPYGPTADPKSMGYIRVQGAELQKVRLQDIDQKLRKTPIVVNLRLGLSFQQFGGGIDDTLECGQDLHAMLLVGKGEENGMEYYLLRNSFGVDYGLEGHYRMSRDAFYKCTYAPYGLVADAHFKRSARNGPHKRANQGPVRQRLQDKKLKRLIVTNVGKSDGDRLIERQRLIIMERKQREAQLAKRGKKSLWSQLNDDRDNE